MRCPSMMVPSQGVEGFPFSRRRGRPGIRSTG
jgi:hypothetical protein